MIRLNLRASSALRRVRVHVAHRVQQPGHLSLTGFDDPGVGMAGGGDAKGGRQVQIFFAIGIPNVHGPGAFPDNRP